MYVRMYVCMYGWMYVGYRPCYSLCVYVSMDGWMYVSIPAPRAAEELSNMLKAVGFSVDMSGYVCMYGWMDVCI